ncbi:MAG: hypothetical protein HUJ25_15580 [Crocinitomicaceae bacterium]|nr:hypothetical protein [Crocinitomicaceae bacterium]
MKEKKNILDHLKKRQKPDVPKDFFENFSDDLMAKIEEEESGLKNFQKTTKPDVPAEFFENFAQNITQKVSNSEETNKPRVIRLKVIGFVTAVAACLLVFFLIKPDNTTPTADNTQDQNNTENAEPISDEVLMAFVDENDIVDFILEEEIDLSENQVEVNLDENTEDKNASGGTNSDLDELDQDDIYQYLEEDLDNIYLEDLEL